MWLFGEGFGDRHCSTETVSSFLDGALRQREMRRVESHLATCSDCALHAEDLKAVVGTLRMMPTAPVPRSFAIPAPVRVFVAAPARPWWQPAPVADFRAMAAAAALALAVVFAGDMSGAIGTADAPVMTGLEQPGQLITPGNPVGRRRSLARSPLPALSLSRRRFPMYMTARQCSRTRNPRSCRTLVSGLSCGLWNWRCWR